jgi:serine/threonine protein kinase
VLSALAYAHVKRDFDGNPLKLIHRDVSPSNILVSSTGEVKLTDFGIAKAATHNSQFYKVKGKIGYMSPEQAKSEPLDHRSDLYSLAVCLFEVLTGERLFVHAGLTTSADEIYSQPVPLISRKVPGLTPDLDAIMHKALALSPSARYQTAGAFQEALTRCAHRNGLLISAPEVAHELLDLCGPPDQWRGDDDEEDLGYVRRAGTEVYDGAADDDDDDDAAASAMHGGSDVSQPGVRLRPPSLPGVPAPALHSVSGRHSSSRISRSKTDMAKLGGVVELTSIINMIDLENQHREAMRERHESGPLAMPAAARSRTTSQPPRRAETVQPPRRAETVQPPHVPDAVVVSSRRRPDPTDPHDLVPTTPRPLRVPGAAPPAPNFSVPVRRESQAKPKKKSPLRTWLVIVAILLAAAAAGVVVAMSGPDVAVHHGK